MIFEFLMMIGHSDIAYLKSYSTWKDRMIHYLCLEDQASCKEEWQQWLSIGGMPRGLLIMDFIYLLATLVTRSSLLETGEDPPIDIKLEDGGDFLASNDPLEFRRNMLMTFLFSGFPYVLLVSLLLYSTTAHGTDTSELISIIYLFFAVYFIVNFRKLYIENTGML
jgi:hypothetical protein